MDEKTRRFIEQLESSYPLPEDVQLVDRLHVIVGETDGIIEPEVIGPIFRFLEHVNDSEFVGNPGPLVHYIEKLYPSYLDELIGSVREKPTTTTVDMVNRVLNSKDEHANAKRDELLLSLELVVNNNSAPSFVLNDARNYLQRHRKK